MTLTLVNDYSFQNPGKRSQKLSKLPDLLKKFRHYLKKKLLLTSCSFSFSLRGDFLCSIYSSYLMSGSSYGRL